MAVEKTIPDHLIQTKLYPPRVPDQLVSRRHLLERLSSGSIPPLTLISAPAGYGKSVLAYQWLVSSKVPYAWLSTDEFDSNLASFLDYLLAALGMIVPDLGTKTGSMLNQPELPKPEHLADSLIRDLTVLNQPVCLAIDDYHTINDRDVHAFMDRLLHYLPADLNLVLISRADPPLTLNRMRAGGQMVEIRAHNLRFTNEEASLLLEQIVGQPVSTKTAELLAERTEGWAVGLRMAAISLGGSLDTQSFIDRFNARGQRLIADYLFSEALDHLPEEHITLFLKSAIVDRFSADLIDTLCGDEPGEGRGQDFIDFLWTSNLFLIALDDQGTWYRFHHLLRQLLLQRLQTEIPAHEITALHQKAGAWFEEKGLIKDAIVHTVAGGDGDGAARVVERHAHEMLNREAWRLLEGWVNLLPDDVLNRPAILVIQAILGQFYLRFNMVTTLLDQADQGFNSSAVDYAPGEARSWKGVIELYRGISANITNTPKDTLRQTEKALRSVEPSAEYIRAQAETWQIIALHQSGRTADAIDMARKYLDEQTGPSQVRTIRLFLALVGVYYHEADVVNLSILGKAFRDVALQTQHPVSVGWANFVLGWSAYQRDDLEKAIIYFCEIADSLYSSHLRVGLDGVTGLVLSQIALGRLDEAAESLALLREFLLDQDRYMLMPLVDSLQKRLDGNLDALSSDMGFLANVAEQMAVDTWEKPVFSWCQAAIEQGDVSALPRVQRALNECAEFVRLRNSRRHLMQIGALEALLSEAQGRHEQALSHLQTAVKLGEPGGAYRIFVDLGPALIPLLRELRNQGIAGEYIRRILDVYGDGAETEADFSREPDHMPRGLSSEAAAIVDRLTKREMEVLLLLAKRLTNKEIAANLQITPHTVKKYTLIIYQKMDVDGRRQAAARAAELGIL